MRHRILVVVAVAGLLAAAVPAAPSPAAIRAERISQTRHPGDIVVRQERVQIDGRSSTVFTVSMPRPGSGHVLEPMLADDMVSAGTATTSSVSRSLGRFGTAVAVNADLFEYASGQPSGLFLRGGEVYNQPQGGRPTLAADTDGTLSVSRPKAVGTLAVGDGRPIPFEVNVLSKDGLVLYDHGWGPRPPQDAARSLLGRVTAGELTREKDAWLARATVRTLRNRSGAQAIPSAHGDDVLFQDYGPGAARLRTARSGVPISLRYRLGPLAAGASFAIGGGPILIRDGRIVYRRDANREFATAQLVPPDARTAVAQLAGGRILFYVVDRGAGSPGFSVAQVARDLERRGARTAMAFDSGGSTAVSIDGRVLNAPADGVERAVGNTLTYLSVDRRHREAIATVTAGRRGPGDRVPPLSYTMLRGAEVSVDVESPTGRVFGLSDGAVRAGTHRVELPAAILRSGRWRIDVTAPASGLRVSRRFTVAAKPVAAPASARDRPLVAGATPSGTASTPAATAARGGGAGPWPWMALGAAALLAAAVLVVRRRRPDAG